MIFILSCSYYAREIQRIYRGHLGRKKVRRELDLRLLSHRLAVEHYAATCIQKIFRGCYSRKYVHDFYARKAYIEQVAAQGENLRKQLEQNLMDQVEKQRQMQEERDRKDFEKVTAGLHHLVSTKARPGILNPAFASDPKDIPSAFGIPLETHLRAATIRHLRTRGLHAIAAPDTKFHDDLNSAHPVPLLPGAPVTRTPAGLPAATAAALAKTSMLPEATAAASGVPVPLSSIGTQNVTLVPAYTSDQSRRSLQASVPYGLEKRVEAEEKKYDKLLRLDQKPFVAGGKSGGVLDKVAPPLGVHATAPYVPGHVAARSLREAEAYRKEKWVAPHTPFVPANSRTSRLFEETERRRVRATGQLLEETGANEVLPAARGVPAHPQAYASLQYAAVHAPAPGTRLLDTQSGGGNVLSVSTRANTAGLLPSAHTQTVRFGDAVVAVPGVVAGAPSAASNRWPAGRAASAAAAMREEKVYGGAGGGGGYPDSHNNSHDNNHGGAHSNHPGKASALGSRSMRDLKQQSAVEGDWSPYRPESGVSWSATTTGGGGAAAQRSRPPRLGTSTSVGGGGGGAPLSTISPRGPLADRERVLQSRTTNTQAAVVRPRPLMKPIVHPEDRMSVTTGLPLNTSGSGRNTYTRY